MAIFKFVSAGSLIVETSDDDAYPTKLFAETIDTWALTSDTGRRRMPRDSGTYARFRDSVNGNSTDWLDLRGNTGNYGYSAKDSGGFWTVHVGRFINETGKIVDPFPQTR